eukprot:767125-Hanusia_phi.AAC.7
MQLREPIVLESTAGLVGRVELQGQQEEPDKGLTYYGAINLEHLACWSRGLGNSRRSCFR